MLYRAAQAMAFLEGRTYCTPEDFKPLVVPVFAHRIVVSGSYSFDAEEVGSGGAGDARDRWSVAVPV